MAHSVNRLIPFLLLLTQLIALTSAGFAATKSGEKQFGEPQDGVFDEVHRGTPSGTARGSLILRGEITQYKPGSETARFMIAGGSSYPRRDLRRDLAVPANSVSRELGQP